MSFKFELKERFTSEGFSEMTILKDEKTESSIIIAAFPYMIENDNKTTGVKIAPFAQKNHYGEAVKRLKKISLFIRERKSLKKSDLQIFCNSNLPEKWFAATSGLGFYGKNSLIITEKSGSRLILAGMILPFPLENDRMREGANIPGALCGTCQKCIINCPTSAIEKNGKINRDLCLQSLATDSRQLSRQIMEQWGNRLYGCSICQDCCPFNKNIVGGNKNIKGDLGQGIEFEFILESDDLLLNEYLKQSALSMSWIKLDLLRRNAIISIVEENRIDLIDLVKKFENHKSISYAAKWTLQKLSLLSIKRK